MSFNKRFFGEFAELRNGVNFVAADTGEPARVVGVGVFQSRTELSFFDALSEVHLSSALSPENELENGDLLFVRSNGSKSLVGRCLLIRDPPPGVTFSGFTIRARVDRSVATPEYVALVFQAGALNGLLATAGGGNGNIANLSQALLSRLPIGVPCLSHQAAIVARAAAWERAIQTTEQLIAAKALYYEGITRRLFLGGSKLPPCCYPSIGEIADRIVRQNDGGDYPLLTISSSSGFVRQAEKFSRNMAGESAKTYTLLRGGEFSYNKGNSKRYEFGCVFQLQGYDAALVPRVYVSFRLHDGVCAAYMRHLFAADYLKPQLRALANTGVRNNGLLNVRPNDFMAVRVPLPTLEDQVRVADALDAIRAEIDLLEKQLRAFREQKRGLMQKLLTDQWQPPVASDGSGKEGD